MFDDAINQMRNFGLLIDGTPDIGKLCRVDVEGDKPRSRNGWYKLYEYRTEAGEILITGAYGSWKMQGDTQRIQLKGGKLTGQDREGISQKIKAGQKLAEKERIKDAVKAGKVARRVWEKLFQLGDSAYLKKKSVRAHGIRFGKNGSIAVPLKDADDTIVGLQWIFPPSDDGQTNKIFWPRGLQVIGSYFLLGKISHGEPIFFAEGYATAATIHEVLNVPVVVAFNSGNLAPVAKFFLEIYPDSAFIFCADDDWKSTDSKDRPYNAGVKFAKAAANATRGYIAMPRFKKRQFKDVDFNDLFLAEGAEAVKACFADIHGEVSHWKTRLARSGTGAYKPILQNIYLILSHDENWEGVIKFCEFSRRTNKVIPPPYEAGNYRQVNNEWSVDDTNRTDVWISRRYGISSHPSVIDAAVEMVARDNAYHPVRDYLTGLSWDGQERLSNWLNVCLGAEQSKYLELVGTKWMIGAVARIMRPGVKNDCVLILEGDQGIGKSTVFEILGGEWFSDTQFTIGDKDGYQQMLGVWIIELAELDSFNKAESTRAKSFFGSCTDRYRPPYGKRVEEFERQCVFAGTTNQESYFKDPTGNRRYWPVKAKKINTDVLRAARDQLFAEAFYRFKQGEVWHVENNEAHLFGQEQVDRFMNDAWEERIEHWINEPERRMKDKFSMGELFENALQMLPMTWKPPEQTRLAMVMTRLGFKKVRARDNETGKRPWMYKRPSEKDTEEAANE